MNSSTDQVGFLKNRHIMAFVVFAATVSLFIGCVSMPKVSQKVIDEYKPEVIPGEGETLVYVFRQSTMLGAAMTISVGYNDKLVGTLASGTYCMFKANAGILTVNLLQGNIPLKYYRLDNRPRETVNLYFEYSSGKFFEVPIDQAIAMITKFKKRENLPIPKPNPIYETGLINPGVLGLTLMRPADSKLEPDSKHAVITFVRASKFAKEFDIGIWNKDGLVGTLKGQTYFQVKVPPGKHLFFGKSEHWSVLEADVEAGKDYYVQVTLSMGWTQGHVRLLPVNADTQKSKLGEWLGESKHMVLDEYAMDDTVKQRLNAALPLIENTIQAVKEGKIETRRL